MFLSWEYTFYVLTGGKKTPRLVRNILRLHQLFSTINLQGCQLNYTDYVWDVLWVIVEIKRVSTCVNLADLDNRI